MTLYAIQQISTGLFLPPGGKGLRGHTHQKPTDKRPPRLFKTAAHARIAMKAWCAGIYYERGYQDSYTGEWDMDTGVTPKSDRNQEDMQVVEIRIAIRQLALEAGRFEVG